MEVLEFRVLDREELAFVDEEGSPLLRVDPSGLQSRRLKPLQVLGVKKASLVDNPLRIAEVGGEKLEPVFLGEVSLDVDTPSERGEEFAEVTLLDKKVLELVKNEQVSSIGRGVELED